MSALRHVAHRISLKDEAKVEDVPAARLGGIWVVARDYADGRRFWAGGDHLLSTRYWTIEEPRAAHFESRAEAQAAIITHDIGGGVLILTV